MVGLRQGGRDGKTEQVSAGSWKAKTLRGIKLTVRRRRRVVEDGVEKSDREAGLREGGRADERKLAGKLDEGRSRRLVWLRNP